MGRVPSSVARHRLPLRQRAILDPGSLRRWVLVLIVAVATAVLVTQVVVRAERSRNRWGARRSVLVVDQPVATGDPVSDAVRVEQWPATLVPEASFERLDAVPAGAAAAGPLGPGSPLTHVAVAAPHDVASRPRVAVPTGLAVLPLSTGDTVAVWSTVVAAYPGAGPTTRSVTEGATVVSADNDTVVLSVDAGDVEVVAEAAALATVTLVATD